ncbi:hypothetical protein Tdes44962_MAKER08866 [Teratosphaeria destructans]|uniref:Uncharacterized protein n=1 Tax=Teratosphaeria destructans TaxID=418781 RepID=A0A9W7SUZ8_9PEZI|nr:hypothetical protein Tdes44962_MAKER08866 [Teratosphaeria destructans]
MEERRHPEQSKRRHGTHRSQQTHAKQPKENNNDQVYADLKRLASQRESNEVNVVEAESEVTEAERVLALKQKQLMEAKEKVEFDSRLRKHLNQLLDLRSVEGEGASG